MGFRGDSSEWELQEDEDVLWDKRGSKTGVDDNESVIKEEEEEEEEDADNADTKEEVDEEVGNERLVTVAFLPANATFRLGDTKQSGVLSCHLRVFVVRFLFVLPDLLKWVIVVLMLMLMLMLLRHLSFWSC
jgi:hypothetical protein